MTRKHLFKIFTSGFVLMLAVCPQIHAHSWDTKICTDSNTVGCWDCGNNNNCTATLYQDGRLVVSGTGEIKGGDGINTTFSGLSVQPISLIIEEGITNTGSQAFRGVSTITSLDLPNSFRSIAANSLVFGGNGVNKLFIGDSTIISELGYRRIPRNTNTITICKGNLDMCQLNLSEKGVNISITDELRDENGNLLQKWSANGSETYDVNGNVLAKYSKSGNLLEQYSYNSDGSITIYDSDNNILGFRGKRIYTIDEAVLVSKPKGNTFKLRYR